MNSSKWVSRKYILVCCTILILSGLLLLGSLSDTSFTQLVGLLVSGYIIGNVTERVQMKDKGENK